MELKNKTALITGSISGGVGRSTAFTLAVRGADIVLNYGTNPRNSRQSAELFGGAQAHDEASARLEALKVQQAIEALGRKAVVIKADTKCEADVESMIRRARAEFGKIDILVNNAGGAWKVRDYTEIDFAEWKTVLAAEIDGAFLTMKHLIPAMREQRWGRVIHLGLTGAAQLEIMAGAAPDNILGKAARAWMTSGFGMQEFVRGITVNCVEPGVIEQLPFETALSAAKNNCPERARRTTADAHDVAELIAFLCSDRARYISGNQIRIPTRAVY